MLLRPDIDAVDTISSFQSCDAGCNVRPQAQHAGDVQEQDVQPVDRHAEPAQGARRAAWCRCSTRPSSRMTERYRHGMPPSCTRSTWRCPLTTARVLEVEHAGRRPVHRVQGTAAGHRYRHPATPPVQLLVRRLPPLGQQRVQAGGQAVVGRNVGPVCYTFGCSRGHLGVHNTQESESGR